MKKFIMENFFPIKTSILLKVPKVINRIFDCINWYYCFNIIKNNKSLLKYLDLDNNFSPIIIEIIPFQDKDGIFINMLKREEKFIHIYFDDDECEYKTNYLDKNHNIKKIKIIIDYGIQELSYLFYKCNVIKSITFKQFKRYNIYYMNCMFARCYNLEEINFDEFNTDNVLEMKCMFYKCYNLRILDLYLFNLKKLLDYSGMFYKCENLYWIVIKEFYFNKSVDTSFMFAYCYSLDHVYLGLLDLSHTKNIDYMFYEFGDDEYRDRLIYNYTDLRKNTF